MKNSKKATLKTTFINYLKNKWWYILLVVASSIYVIYYRHEIYQLQELNTHNLIFLLWLALLILPLFSEMEFFGVRLKKEVQKATGEIKDDLQKVNMKLIHLETMNSIATTVTLNYLPDAEHTQKLTNYVQKKQNVSNNTTPASDKVSLSDIGNDNIMFLFEVRFWIESNLRRLCEKIGYADVPFIEKMVQYLKITEVIDEETSDLILQVSKIINRGIHGELINDQYFSLVKNAYPEIKQQLAEIENSLTIVSCPRCRYTGYSRYIDRCPRCGAIICDD